MRILAAAKQYRTMTRFGLFCTIALVLALLTCRVGAETLTLLRTESLWREANTELKLARYAIDAATGDLNVADRRENPNFSLSSTSLSPQSGIGAGGLRSKNADSVLRLEQLLERGGKREHRTHSAEARVNAARLDADEAERTGLIQLQQAYWDLKLAFEREKIAAASMQLARDTIAAAERRLKAGDIAAADVSRLRVDALRSENEAQASQADRVKAQWTLAILIGRGSDAAELSCADDWPQSVTAPSLNAPAGEQWDTRADIAAANARVAAAESALAAARALAKRDVTVGLQYEHYPTVGDQPPNNTWGLSISIPLFASHAYEGELLRARAELEQSRELARRAAAMARNEFNRAANDFRVSLDRLLPEAVRVAAAAEFAYGKGATGLLDLLDARRTLRQIQQEAAVSKSDYAKALAAVRLQFPTAVAGK